MEIYIRSEDNIAICDGNDKYWLDILMDGLDVLHKNSIYLNSAQINRFKRTLISSIEKLPLSTKVVLKQYYGLDGIKKTGFAEIALAYQEFSKEYITFKERVKKDLEETNQKENIDDTKIGERIVKTCRRRLWHPSRRIIRGILFGDKYVNGEYESSIDFKSVIYDEINKLIGFHQCVGPYLGAFFRRHKIEVKVKESEIEDVLEGFSFEINRDEDKTTYKVKGMLREQIINYIYEQLFSTECSNIIDEEFWMSHGLRNILLLKGYVFNSEIKVEQDVLYKEMEYFFPEYAEEIKLLYEDKMLFTAVSDEASKWIQKQGISNVRELKIALSDTETSPIKEQLIHCFGEDEDLVYKLHYGRTI